MTRAAVLGSPIAHSLSPILHRAAYAALGLDDWTYERHECAEDGLAAYLAEDFVGLSLTMPLKRVALDLADERSDLAVQAGGANTLVRLPNGGWAADNTDVYGIVQALAEGGVTELEHVVVLGGGATAASSLAAAAQLGARRAILAVRTPERAAATAEVGARFGLTVEVRTLTDLAALLTTDLLFSTLPGDGAAPYADLIADAKIPVFDAIYAPWPTALATAVLTTHGTVVNGFAMLLHQAVRQVTLMTGQTAPVEAMRAAGNTELTRREQARRAAQNPT
ncbi:shikimate dehydrogenase [Actinocorallia sp. API 0066]|uniref:shikimate dehydrogenase n=1 Tax=Actinocorallia sp. API 0066 TaxID=2896846 RepID=UPI001E54E0D3|nr:shikimate dehydrogenase [Actinocorallia sp. API 0066]MCD0449009.1 shikimate dehydrogenase [Actinocorallia sp. API 0066]